MPIASYAVNFIPPIHASTSTNPQRTIALPISSMATTRSSVVRVWIIPIELELIVFASLAVIKIHRLFNALQGRRCIIQNVTNSSPLEGSYSSHPYRFGPPQLGHTIENGACHYRFGALGC